MKEEINNEMDVLLRRLSRRNGTTRLNGEDLSSSDHLDVDELNAYSENTLPEKTRLRYTGHLADCEQCRRLVTELTQFARVELPKTQKPQASWLVSFLGRFLSPFTWRFALPALAAVGIVAIGLIVLRREPARELTAQKADQAKPQSVASAPAQSEQSPSNFQDGLNSRARSTPATADGRIARPAEPTIQEKTSSDRVASNRVESPALAKDQPAALAGAAPPAAAGEGDVARLDDAERHKNEDLKKVKQAEEDRDKAASINAQVATQRRVDELREAPSPKSPAVGALQVSPGVSSSVASAGRGKREGKEEESKNESETKTVAGRQFRRQGNLWMDTGYNSSMPTLTVARGSESYRALVADEPAIRSIAEQLDGDIVVVWKGKAYRIR